MSSAVLPPWSLENNPSAGWALREVANRIRKDPSGLIVDTSGDLLSDGLVGPMTTMRHGDVQVHLPIIGSWPPDHDPTAITDTLRELSDACHGESSHEEDLLPLMTAAVAIAIVDGRMSEQAVVNDGCHVVELCLEEGTTKPVLYVATRDENGEEDAFQILVPEGDGFPPIRIPCFIQERQAHGILSVIMTFAASDTDGVTSESVHADAMDVLRFGMMRDGTERA